MSTTTRSSRPGRSLLRSRGAVMASLLAILSGGAATGALMASAIQDPDSSRAGRIAAVVPQVDPRTLSGPAYAEATPGTCLTWSIDAADQVTSFTAVDCAEPHRFEVAARIPLSDIPGFGDGAPLPDAAALAPVGSDRCLPLHRRLCRPRRRSGGPFHGAWSCHPPGGMGQGRSQRSVRCRRVGTRRAVDPVYRGLRPGYNRHRR